MKKLEFLKIIIPGLKKICDHFGADNQFVKLDEECTEFLESRELQEVADVFIVSSQLVISSPVLMKIVIKKIARTLERIKSGYYETRN